MTKIEQAISAARGELRHKGFNPHDCSVSDAEKVLDDMALQNKMAGLWFWNASNSQIKRFRKEWEKCIS